MLGVTLFFFGFGYLLRFIWDLFLIPLFVENTNEFSLCFVFDIVCFAEGIAFLILMLYHRRNFKVAITINKHISERHLASNEVSSYTNSGETIVMLDEQTRSKDI